MTSSRNGTDKNQSQTESRGRRNKPAVEAGGPSSASEGKEQGLLDSMQQGYSQETFQRHAALLGDPRMSLSANARQQAQVVRQIQRGYGNQYVQRLVGHVTRGRTTKADATGLKPDQQANSSAITTVQRDWQGPSGEVMSDTEYEARFGPVSQEGWLQISSEVSAATAPSDESVGLTQVEREEDAAVSTTILGLLNEFENIGIRWTEEQPEDFVGPPRGFQVNVRAVYFIATDAGETDVEDERQQERFTDIVRELSGETSVMVSGGGRSRSAGQTVQYGKATPDDVKKFVEKAVELGIITTYARRRGNLAGEQELVDLPNDQIQEIIQDWINETRVGVDCSGLVAQAALRAEQTRGALLGPPESPLPSTARIRNARSFANGPRVNQPSDLRPGQAWVVKGGGHIRMVAEVDPKEDHVEFVTVESAGGSLGGHGPTRRTWRTNNLEQFHRITLIEGPRGNPRGGTFHEIP